MNMKWNRIVSCYHSKLGHPYMCAQMNCEFILHNYLSHVKICPHCYAPLFPLLLRTYMCNLYHKNMWI